MDDADLDALYSDPPWRMPAPLPPGDERWDAAMAEVASRTPGGVSPPTGAVLRAQPARVRAAISAILRDPRPPAARDPWLLVGPGPTYQRVRLRAGAALTAWVYRQWTLEHLLAALELSDEDVAASLFAEARASEDRTFAEGVVHALLRAAPPPRGVLDVLVGELDPGRPWSPFAAEALLVRDGVAAMGPLAAYFAACPPPTRAQAALRVALRRDRVDFDEVPAWVDLLVPASLHNLELFGHLMMVKTSEPLLPVLAARPPNAMWADCLNRLRALDDPAAAPRLRRFQGSVPAGPYADEKKLIRVVKHLERKRTTPTVSTELRDAVGTDGGPVVLGAPAALARWRGADPDAPLEVGDYARACAACAAGPGWVLVGEARVLVLPSPQVAVGRRAAAWLFVGRGEVTDVEADWRRFRKQRGTLEVGPDGLVLLDAAHRSESAPSGGVERLAVPPGSYSVAVAESEALSAVRLEPVAPRT